MGNKFFGNVEWFNAKSGYGFISYEIEGVKQTDIFLHFSDIVCDGFKTIKKDQHVSFGIGQNNKGQPKAIEVTVINEKNKS
jgi:CspA family cold shock protein